jgi:ABC-type Zn2+ transport system substrate-binding protein/surface adhesin
MAQIETTRQLLEQEMKKKTPAQELEEELAGMRERGEVRAHTHTNTHTHNHTHTHTQCTDTHYTRLSFHMGLLQDCCRTYSADCCLHMPPSFAHPSLFSKPCSS